MSLVRKKKSPGEFPGHFENLKYVLLLLTPF
jgi:hypothetical protein